MAFDDLVDKTALAFTGTVIESDPTHFDETRQEPVTKVTFLINEVMKGETSDQDLELFLPGGVYPNGEVLEYENAPVFQDNETYLVFVRGGPWSITPITNWWHSAFREAEVDGKRMLINQFGRAVTKVDGNGFAVGPRVSLPEQTLMSRSRAQRSFDRVQPTDTQLLERNTVKLRDDDSSEAVVPLRPEVFTATKPCAGCADATTILGSTSEMIHARMMVAPDALASPGAKRSVQPDTGRVMSRARPMIALHADRAKLTTSLGTFTPSLNVIASPTKPSVDESIDVDTFPQEDSENRTDMDNNSYAEPGVTYGLSARDGVCARRWRVEQRDV